MIKSVLPKVAAAGILAVLVWRLGTGAFVAGFRQIDGPAVAAALGIGLLTTVFSAWRWRLTARGLGMRLALPAAVADYYQALLLNSVLPMGVLGDVHRAVSHGKQNGDVGRGVRAVVLERFAGQIVTVAAGLVVILTQPHMLPGPVALAGCCAGLAAAAVAVYAFRERFAILRDARRVLLARDTGPRVLALSVAVLLGHVALFVVAARVAGSGAPVLTVVPLMILALVAMGLPINIGGWGPREAATTMAFAAAGLGAEQGLTAAVVYGVLTTIAALPGAFVIAGRRAAPLLSRPARRPALGLED